MFDFDDFKVGDYIKIINLINNDIKYGKLLEFNEKYFLMEMIPLKNKIKWFYKPFLKIERIN